MVFETAKGSSSAIRQMHGAQLRAIAANVRVERIAAVRPNLISDEDLQAIAMHPRLQMLNFFEGPNITLRGLKTRAKMPAL
jgi:hypothetical protein